MGERECAKCQGYRWFYRGTDDVADWIDSAGHQAAEADLGGAKDPTDYYVCPRCHGTGREPTEEPE